MPGRRRADPGSERLYRTGTINDGAHLDRVAIVDLRATSNFEIHTDYHSYAMRARLDRSNGHHDNQVIWTHTVPEMAAVADQAFVMLDQWLEAVEADTSGRPLETKIVRNKPAAAIDTCFIDGERQAARELCDQHYPYYGSPRLVAGMPMTHDILSCQFKPLDPADHAHVQFSGAQWARLEATFPHGVCDYAQPAIGQESSAPWMTYAEGPGGRPLDPARPSG